MRTPCPAFRTSVSRQMNFKSIYDPRHVYEGYFETYFIRPFFHHYADFRGHETWGSCGLSFLAWLIVSLGITGLMLGLVGLLGPEVGFTSLTVAGCVWGAFSLLPLSALVVRASASRPDTSGRGSHKHPLLGIDIMLGTICLLFFIFGLLMTVTTLHSETLTADPGTDEQDTTRLELEEIVEEPIFTYQDEAPADTVTADSLSDLEDPEAVAPDESFDPSLSGDGGAAEYTDSI